jgi:hypothetical protein
VVVSTALLDRGSSRAPRYSKTIIARRWRWHLAEVATVFVLVCASGGARAQAGAWPPNPGGQWGPATGPAPYYPQPQLQARTDTRSDLEIGSLYVTSVAYGAGLGVWFSAELGVEDPAVFLIPPALLGVAAPIGVWFLDDPSMPRGMPAAIATGMLVGAGEGIGIASYQFVTADERDEWGFKGLARGTALGATLGAVGGYAAGYYLEPSPKSSVLMGSGVLWGTTIGTLFGYGASKAGVGYDRANDSAGLGGLIGFNLGLAATAGLSTVFIPSWDQLAWMWTGGGIGAAASLPIFLFYAGDGGPPAKRGFLFMGTATTLGIAAGGIFSSDEVAGYEIGRSSDNTRQFRWANITSFGPMALSGGAGLQVTGTLY